MQAIIDNIESQQANHICTFQAQALEACELTEMWADKARIALCQRKALMETMKRALIWRARSAIKRRMMNPWHGRCAKTSLLIIKCQKFKRAQQMRSVERVIREWAGVTSNSTRISTQADRQVMAVHGRAVQRCYGQWKQHTRRQRLAQCAVLDSYNSIRAPRLGLIAMRIARAAGTKFLGVVTKHE
jgi:hypothetical protein